MRDFARLPDITPAEPNGAPAVLRFRERVRSRIGSAEVLAFRVGGEHFAFDVRALDEAIETPTIDPLPFAPARAQVEPASKARQDSASAPSTSVHSTRDARAMIRGLVRMAGRSIPVFDTAALLGVRDAGEGGQLLVMRSGSRRIGLLADEVDDVCLVELATIQPPPVENGDDLLLGVTWDGQHVTGILDARTLIQACQQRGSEVLG